MKRSTRRVLIGLGAAMILFALLGIITALLPNPWFARMTPPTFLDYLLLAATATLSAAHIGLPRPATCTGFASTGTLGGAFGFACPLCNKVLVLLIGTGGILTFIEPYRHMLGVAGVLLLGTTLWWRAHDSITQIRSP